MRPPRDMPSSRLAFGGEKDDAAAVPEEDILAAVGDRISPGGKRDKMPALEPNARGGCNPGVPFGPKWGKTSAGRSKYEMSGYDA